MTHRCRQGPQLASVELKTFLTIARRTKPRLQLYERLGEFSIDNKPSMERAASLARGIYAPRPDPITHLIEPLYLHYGSIARSHFGPHHPQSP